MTSSVAPASARSVAGGPGCHTSSQIVGPTSTLAHLEEQELAPGREVAVLVEDAVVRAGSACGRCPRRRRSRRRRRRSRGRGRRQGRRRARRVACRPARSRRPRRARHGRTRAGGAGPPGVARDGELREDDEVGARTRRLGDRLDDARRRCRRDRRRRRSSGRARSSSAHPLRSQEATALRFSTLDHKRHSSCVHDDVVTIGRRYRGPLDSANGGYTAGLLGSRLDGAAEVTLAPAAAAGAPLDRPSGRRAAPPRG